MRTEKMAEMNYWKELTRQLQERFNNERCGQREGGESCGSFHHLDQGCE